MAKKNKKSKAKTEEKLSTEAQDPVENVPEIHEQEQKNEGENSVEETPAEGIKNGDELHKNGDFNGSSTNRKELEDKIAQLTLRIKEKDAQLEAKDKNAQETEALSKTQNNDNTSIEDSEEAENLREKVREAQDERDKIKSSYDTLLSRLSSMKSVFSKMKESEVELEEARETIAKLEEENETLKASSNEELVKKLTEQNEDLNSECDRLSTALSKSEKEYQAQIEELQDERYNLENQGSKLTKRSNELRSEINELSLIKDELSMENRNLSSKIEELMLLQNAKDEDVITIKAKLDESQRLSGEQEKRSAADIQSKDREIKQLEAKITEVTEKAQALESELETSKVESAKLKEELSTVEQLKHDLNNKQLLIGKLRHEAVILNEHLTKSLTMLKQKDSDEKVIDKELISNVIISFLQIPRGDTKKFEALQLISGLLEWDNTQKVAAGLSHLGGSHADENAKITRQSFVSLWTDFLERESRKGT